MNATELYEKLNALDYSKVDRRVERDKLGGNSIGAVRKETLKFLALCASDETPNAPSKIVDDFEHGTLRRDCEGVGCEDSSRPARSSLS